MSHISNYKTIKGKPLISCIDSCLLAAKNLGLEVHERKTYKWYGHHVGDWKVPEGWKVGDMGNNAEFVLSVSPEKRKELGIGADCYELAIVKDPNNPGCYTVMYDFFDGGKGLDKVIGSPVIDHKTQEALQLAPTFIQHYRMCADALSAKETGDEISFEKQNDGSWVSYTVPNEDRMREAV